MVPVLVPLPRFTCSTLTPKGIALGGGQVCLIDIITCHGLNVPPEACVGKLIPKAALLRGAAYRRRLGDEDSAPLDRWMLGLQPRGGD